jgi:hypothetical protein
MSNSSAQYVSIYNADSPVSRVRARCVATDPNENCFQKLPILVFFDCRLFQSSLRFLPFRSLFLILPFRIFQMTSIELLVWAIHTLPLTARTCSAEYDWKQEIQICVIQSHLYLHALSFSFEQRALYRAAFR